MDLGKKNTGKYSYLFKNTLFLTISSFASKILNFFFVPLYTQVLTTEEYGVADIIMTTATLCMYIFTLNIDSAVLRFAIDKNEKSDKVFSFSIKILLSGTFLLGMIVLLFSQMQLVEWKSYYFLFLVLIFFVDALRTILFQYLRAIDKVKETAVAGIIDTIIRIITNIVFLLVLKIGVLGYLLSLVVGPIVCILFMIFKMQPFKFSEKSKEYEKRLHKEMVKYSVPVGISQLAWWANNSLDRYFITGFCGASLNGVYAISYKIPSVMSMLCNIFGQAWGLSAIKDFDKDDKNGFFSNIYKLFNTALILSCSFLIIFNKPISKFIFANEFYTAWQYSSILILAMMFSGLSGFFYGVFAAVKDNKPMVVTTIIAVVINIVFNVVLVPFYSAYGAAIATAISFYVTWLGRYLLSRKYLRFNANIIKSHIMYFLLIVQIFVEHIFQQAYLVQIIILIILVVLCGKEFKLLIDSIFKNFREFKTKRL